MGFAGKVVLITGGTGYLGSALTHKLLEAGARVRAFARNEHRHEALSASIPQQHQAAFSSLMGDVRDRERLARAFSGVDLLIHAAAQKIVSLAEYNPLDCVKTNIAGTANVIDAAIDAGIEKALFISTDKARSPSTVYGATKLCAERLWLAANRYKPAKPLFSAIVLGNVFGSTGSVIWNFLHQSRQGPIRVTDPEMTRFHMTLPKTVDIVLAALDHPESDTLWVPKLPSYRLGDLAQAFACAAGCLLPPVTVGRWAGEKTHEELITETESLALLYQDETHYVLAPGHDGRHRGWAYSSNDPRGRLSVDILTKEVSDWLSDNQLKGFE